MGRVIRHLERTLAELDAARASLVRAAATEERRRIARDVHDLVGHSLTAMLLNVRAARQTLESDPVAAAGALDDAVRIGRSGLVDLRSSMPGLRDPVASPDESAADRAGVGTAPMTMSALPDGRSIRELLGRQPDLRVIVRGRIEDLGGPLGVATFRILQECLTNIARHARPGSATLTLDVDDDAVVLRSTNALAEGTRGGLSADAAAPRSFGLVGMRERVASLGGRLAARRDGDRWLLDCELPRR